MNTLLNLKDIVSNVANDGEQKHLVIVTSILGKYEKIQKLYS